VIKINGKVKKILSDAMSENNTCERIDYMSTKDEEVLTSGNYRQGYLHCLSDRIKQGNISLPMYHMIIVICID
jgi:hypothetical protein